MENQENKQRAEDALLEMGGKLCELIGWRRIIGQIYIFLYLSPTPLCLDEIAERVNMSKSTIWGAVKKLQEICAIHKVWVKDEYKDYFTAERDLKQIFQKGIIPVINSKLLFAGNYFDQAEQFLNSFSDSQNEFKKEELVEFQALINELKNQKDSLGLLLNQLNLFLNQG